MISSPHLRCRDCKLSGSRESMVFVRQLALQRIKLPDLIGGYWHRTCAEQRGLIITRIGGREYGS